MILSSPLSKCRIALQNQHVPSTFSWTLSRTASLSRHNRRQSIGRSRNCSLALLITEHLHYSVFYIWLLLCLLFNVIIILLLFIMLNLFFFVFIWFDWDRLWWFWGPQLSESIIEHSYHLRVFWRNEGWNFWRGIHRCTRCFWIQITHSVLFLWLFNRNEELWCNENFS